MNDLERMTALARNLNGLTKESLDTLLVCARYLQELDDPMGKWIESIVEALARKYEAVAERNGQELQ